MNQNDAIRAIVDSASKVKWHVVECESGRVRLADAPLPMPEAIEVTLEWNRASLKRVLRVIEALP